MTDPPPRSNRRRRDRWPELCKLVERDDGLAVRDCGPWTEDKLWLWHRYIDVTTTAMVGSPHWPEGLAYVDLFAGPGVCRIKESGKRLPGSPLIAAHAAKPFERIVAVEFDPDLAAACETRLSATPNAARCSVVCGDCAQVINTAIQVLPARALTLAFIDPEGLDVDFEMLRRLAENRRVDFLLLFADAVDLVRNVAQYEQVDASKLDRMLGPDSGWRDQYRNLPNQSGPALRQLFPKIYESQIKRLLGYQGIRQRIIEGPRGPLYRLLYASKHTRGLDFWDKVDSRDRAGQQNLFGSR